MQELIWRYKKWILLQGSAHNHHWVGSEDVHHDACAKLGEIIRSYDRVAIPRQDVIQPSLVFHEVINSRPILQRPFHLGDQPRKGKALRWACLEDFLDQRQHRILVEVALSQVRVLPDPYLELVAGFSERRVDPSFAKASEMIASQSRIHDVEGTLASIDALLDEGQQNPVALVLGSKEGADMPRRLEA